MKIAVFPGSFDPITLGHVDIIKRALPLFDKVIVAIGQNSQKQFLFSLENRIEWIKEVFKNEPKIEVDSYSKLTVRYCTEIGADFIIRGLRSTSDFEYEKSIAQFNKAMEPVETIFLISEPSLSPISSTIVRDIIRNDGDPSRFLPKEVKFKAINLQK